jgi:HK97 family phage major capsid protein
MSHISSRIPQKIKKAEDWQILLGAGAGSDLVGLMQNASAFAAGSFATAIPAAQEIDCLYVAISQLTQGNYEASGIVLNPIDATKIELIKSTTREYVDSMRAIRGTDGVLRIAGIPVIETTAMTAGYFLVGDLKMACEWLLFTPLTMSISDSHASIFLNNEVCINFEEEPVFPIYNPLMFVKGQFSVVKAAISSSS